MKIANIKRYILIQIKLILKIRQEPRNSGIIPKQFLGGEFYLNVIIQTVS